MPDIKCGNCGDYHDGVAGVRACYAGEYGPTDYTTRPTVAAASTNPVVATAKQRDYIDTLCAERGLEQPAPEKLSKQQASAEITRLLAIPRLKKSPTVTMSNPILDRDKVKEGRYAVEIDGTLKFYKVDKPTEGRWSGYTFVKVQASDDLYPVRGRAGTAVLAAIAKDPQGAMLRYGKELGACGHCGRTLTNEESRRIGIGPICRRGMGGWMDSALAADDSDAINADWAAQKDEAAKLEREQEEAAYAAMDADLVPESDSPIR